MPTMQAVQVAKANGPLEVVERDVPEPPDGHVLIKVQACGICHSDSFTIQGLVPIQFPRVPGHEVERLHVVPIRVLVGKILQK